MAPGGLSLRDQVIVLINEANLSDSPEEKLAQAQEILLKRERALLGEFLEHMLDFQVRSHPSAHVCVDPPPACGSPSRHLIDGACELRCAPVFCPCAGADRLCGSRP